MAATVPQEFPEYVFSDHTMLFELLIVELSDFAN